MSQQKERLSASVDADMIKAGRNAVAGGTADSLSAWVNEALHRQAEHDQHLRSLSEFIAAYEAEHGEITEEEMAEVERRDRERAIIVRGRKQGAA